MPEEYEAALREAWRVLIKAEALASAVKEGSVMGTQELVAEFPWITQELAARAIQQGMYFH